MLLPVVVVVPVRLDVTEPDRECELEIDVRFKLDESESVLGGAASCCPPVFPPFTFFAGRKCAATPSGMLTVLIPNRSFALAGMKIVVWPFFVMS